MLHRDIASYKDEHEDTGVSGDDDDDDGFPLADADDNDHIPWEGNALDMVTQLPEKAEETTCIDHVVVVVAAGKFGPVCLPFHRVSAKSSARHAQSTLVPCSIENCCCCCCCWWCCCWLQRRVNAQNRHARFIGIYGVLVTSGAEYIGGVVVPGVRKFTLSASAETLGMYGVSFA